jgi:fibronectin type 3 domain-containing protein
MRRYLGSALVFVALLVGLLVTVAPLSQEEQNPNYTYRNGCPVWEETQKSYCPERYDSLTTSKDAYDNGEEVVINLSDLRDFEHKVDKVEVHFKPLFEHDYELIYTDSDVDTIPRGADEWSWSWNGVNDAGERVGEGRGYIRITLNCCKNYRTYFRVNGAGGTDEVPAEPAEEPAVQLPGSPGNLSSGMIGSTEVELTWQDNSDNEDGFRIYRNGEEIATVGANVTSYTDTGLQPGTSYNYRVVAFNESGESSTGVSTGIETPTPVEAPSSPGGLSSRVISPNQLELTWQDNSDNEDGFRIYRNGEEIATVGSNVTSYSDAGLEGETNYTYRVAAFNEGGESSTTGGLSVTTPVEVSVAPGGLSSEALSPTEIKLTWEDNSDKEDGFRIYRNGKGIAELDPNTTSYVDTGLTGGTAYTYKVSSFNEAGESAFSSGLSVNTPVQIPAAPGRLETETVSPMEVELTWRDNSDNEDGFRIYRNGNRVATVGSNTTSYVHGNLDSETRYCYQVVAFNNSGESKETNRNCTMTLKSIPAIPGNLKATPLSQTRIRLNWNDNADNESGYRVYRNGERIATLGPDTTRYVDTGLNANQAYSYEVSAFNDSGESGLSTSGSVKTLMEEQEQPTPEPEEERTIGQAELLAGAGIVVMVMGYIYSELG